ncbi:MAG: hypothetical protein R6W92_09985 [Desulfocurvibacter africanus]
MPPRTYDTIIDFDDVRLRHLIESGRRMLKVNDTLMCASLGKEHTIFGEDKAGEALEVALVNLCYAVVSGDWKLVGIAVAALELAIPCGKNDPPDLEE